MATQICVKIGWGHGMLPDGIKLTRDLSSKMFFGINVKAIFMKIPFFLKLHLKNNYHIFQSVII